MTPAETARRHLERLAASPRPAGSPAEALARAYCADELSPFGFRIAEERFEYSTIPGRFATPAAGAVSIVALGAAGHLGSRGHAALALGVLIVAMILGSIGASWLARHGVTRLPLGRATAINLSATRGSDPGTWLVAHLDSKSQPVPMVARVLGIIASATLWLIALGVATAQLIGAPLELSWVWISVGGLLAGLPVAASFVGTRSPGALDNASGVATVLEAARMVERSAPLGILLTSAEELGLAGARAWAATHPAALAINCDGIDDAGALTCMYARRRGSRTGAALESAAIRLGVSLRVRRLIPGILTDAVALADAGWDCTTISRGNWRTLARIHSTGDRADRLGGSGVVEAAVVVAATVGFLAKNR